MFSAPRSSLPEIATDYPRLELLESGHIQDWLSSRAAQLSDRAHVNSNWADWLKLTSLLTGGLTAGLALSTPLAPAILLLSLTSYFAAVGEDREITREVYPLPWVRMSLLKILRSAMDTDYREKEEFAEKYTIITLTDGTQSTIDRPEIRIEKEKLFTYLSLEDRSEATMLMDNLTARKMGKPEISAILAECPSKNRFLLYRLILREYQDYGNLALSPAQIQYLCQEINDYYELDQKQIDRFSVSPTLPNRRPENALQPIAPVDNYLDPVARHPVQQPRIEPIVSFAPPDDRPPQSQRREVIEPKEPKVDYVLDIGRLEAETIAPSPVVPSPVAPVPQRGSPRETGIEKLMSNPFHSYAFFGAQRTGKSYLVACATQRLAEQSIKIFHLNLASLMDEEDDRYWHHAQSVRADLGFSEPDQAKGIIADAINLIQGFIAAPPGAILVFDEWTILGRKTHTYSEQLEPLTKLMASTISQLVSSGKKRHKAIWTIAPDMVAGGLTDMSKLAVKDLTLVLVAVPPWKTVTWQHSTGGLPSSISFSHELYGQLQKNYAGLTPPVQGGFLSTSDRIVFTEGSWYPAGVDKDSLKTIVKQGENSYVTLSSERTVDLLSQEFNAFINKE